MHVSATPKGLVIMLGLIGALGPAAVDMYLASLPDIAREFTASSAQVQLSLTVFLLALGGGQLLFGPLTDTYGRRRPLLAGMLLFALASLMAACATSLGILLWARGLQGLAGALGLVVVMSTIRDVASGERAARLFAVLMTIEGVAPILAPSLGGLIDALYGWRTIMGVLAVYGSMLLLMAWRGLPETLPAARRLPLQPAKVLKRYAQLLVDKRFARPAAALVAVFCFLFAYISGAPFVYQQQLGLSSQAFGMVFGASGLAILLGAMSVQRWVGRLGAGRLAMLGAACMLLGSLGAVAALAGGLGVAGLLPAVALCLFGLGLAEATLVALVMGEQQQALGTAAALLGALQLSFSSVATPLAGVALAHGSWAWGVLLALAALAVVMLTWLSVRGTRASGLAMAH